MSHTFKDAKVFLGGYDLTGYTNNVALQYGAEPLDETTLGNDTRKFKGGVKIVSAGMQGFWDATPDPGLQASVGTADTPLSVVAPPGATGTTTYLFRAMNANYDFGGSFGELLSYTAEARATDDLVRGKVLYHGTATSTANGTAFSFPSMAAGDTLCGAIHVVGASAGDTLDVIVQSDTATGFGSPVTALTFSQFGSSIGSEWQTATGATADTYYRVSYTIGGSSPSYTFAVSLGIK